MKKYIRILLPNSNVDRKVAKIVHIWHGGSHYGETLYYIFSKNHKQITLIDRDFESITEREFFEESLKGNQA